MGKHIINAWDIMSAQKSWPLLLQWRGHRLSSCGKKTCLLENIPFHYYAISRGPDLGQMRS